MRICGRLFAEAPGIPGPRGLRRQRSRPSSLHSSRSPFTTGPTFSGAAEWMMLPAFGSKTFEVLPFLSIDPKKARAGHGPLVLEGEKIH